MKAESQILSCDWGSTSLRLRLVTTGTFPKVAAEFRSNDGVATLAAATGNETRGGCFKRTLRGAIHQLQQQTGESLDNLPIIISGMAGSSIGWQSLPYARLPFRLNGQ